MWEICNVPDKKSILKRATKATPREITQFFIHLVCLCILFLLPEMIASFDEHSRYRSLKFGFYLKPIVWVLVFYASFYFTTDPTSRKPNAVLKFVVQILFIFILAMTGLYFIWHFNMPVISTGQMHAPTNIHISAKPLFPPPPPHHPSFLSLPTLRDMVMILLTISLAQCIKFIYKVQRIEQHRRDLMAQARETELRQLKAQLKPHFLFNTLNSIYALIDIDSDKAQRAIHKLSKMLRYMLYENSGTVTVAEETDFIRNYIALMKLRLPSSIPLEVDISTDAYANRPIAPLIFINVMENAFKYGSRARTPGSIKISLVADADSITCATSNNYDPPSGDAPHGIGLSNLSRRLNILYPGRHKLTSDSTDGVFHSTLIIDISAPPSMDWQLNFDPTRPLQHSTDKPS